jgi:chromate transporter
MSTTVLLWILLKATLLSFSGFGSLPLLRDELVATRGVLSDDELNRAIAVARATPGPMGAYVVAVGYAAGGWPGAVVGWVALSAPALAVIPIAGMLARRRQSARWASAIEATILASSALVLATVRSMLPTAIVDLPTGVVAVGAVALITFSRAPVAAIVIGGAMVTWLWR